MFRMLKRNPDRVPMDRLGEYLRLFAELLGTENQPIFKGIKKASTGLKAFVPEERLQHVQVRLKLVHTEATSRPARIAADLEAMLGADGIKEAQLLDASDNVIHLFHGVPAANEEVIRVWQEGTVDGVVTGLVGADDTMHLHLRGLDGHDVKVLVRDESLARGILAHFRNGCVRVTVRGHWVRGEDGWHPETNKCTAKSFDVLEDTPLSKVFQDFAAVPDSGWRAAESPDDFWRELRGIH
ncbi:hypothetical protein CDO81_27210 [Roseateles puraquae]|uniref:Uncharacterized protein n=2 Tax=Roseateles puraquae TaxID=431059 RepID=A0A254N763_9BURK|nr:hypothetical protein CDO81_27210 [Roseateles puraquae]